MPRLSTLQRAAAVFGAMAGVGLTVAVVASPRAPLVRDLDGRVHRPFAPGQVRVLVFVTSDCPISNGYAPEIQRVCGAYAARGVDCLLLYEDMAIEPSAARHHRAAYRLGPVAAAIDADGAIASAAGATVTPEAVVIDAAGATRYRGRIDDAYAALGRRRPAPTTHDLTDALDAVLAARPVLQPKTEAFGCFIIPPALREQAQR